MLYVGTSGWQYRHWRGAFYPPRLNQDDWLEFYAERFQTVELNNSFYRLPEAETFAAWAERTPDDFMLAVKMSRFLTHQKRLKDPDEPIQRFFDRATKLGRKLGPVLIQLPPNLQLDAERLDRVLDLIPPKTRVAVEFRHDSWFTDEVRHLLTGHKAALCLADSPRRQTPRWRTADWGFIRFHEGRGRPHPCYSPQALKRWAEELASIWKPDEDVFSYFNNDGLACALRDAALFAARAANAGLKPTRVPEPAPEVGWRPISDLEKLLATDR